MGKTILIGLNGYKGSGKNTAARFIEQWGGERGLVTVERAFADTLKLSAARSLGLATNFNDAIVLMDSLKESGDISISIPEQSIMRDITGREFLKWFGTEGHRDVFGEDFWVDVLVPKGFDDAGRTWLDNFAPNANDDDPVDICVITDLRFANEARRVRDLGGVVWNVDRGLAPDDHPSEQPLPSELVDLTLSNRSTLEAFETEVRSAMTADFHMRFVERPDPVAGYDT